MIIITKKELAKLWGVSERTIDLWKANHGLPFIKLGAVLRFDELEATIWLTKFQQRRESK